jgi:hypothetical protein
MSSTRETKTIKDVTFAYTSVTVPQKQLNPENKPPKTLDPLEMHSYEVKILVSETVFKQLKKAFPGAKNFPNVKDYTAADCVAKNLMATEPDEDQVLIKFAQTCLYGTAENRKKCRPITQIGIAGRVQDINGKTINQDTNLGNGTKGHLQFTAVKSDFGLYLYPAAICVTELVEYVSENTGTDLDAFGITELGSVDLSKDIEPESDEFADDIPF